MVSITSKCEGLFCQTEPEYVVVYGCLEGHIADRRLCLAHKEMYLAVILKTRCMCGKSFAEVMEDVLPVLTGYVEEHGEM